MTKIKLLYLRGDRSLSNIDRKYTFLPRYALREEKLDFVKVLVDDLKAGGTQWFQAFGPGVFTKNWIIIKIQQLQNAKKWCVQKYTQLKYFHSQFFSIMKFLRPQFLVSF